GPGARQPSAREADGELRLGDLADVVLGEAGGELGEDVSVGGDVEDGGLGDDAVDDAHAGQRERALVDDLGGAVLGGVLHHHDDAAGAGDEVHRAAHALDELAGDLPVGDVAGGGDLHGAEDRGGHLPAADHAEAGGGVEDRGAWAEGDGLLAGVDEVGVLLPLVGEGAHAHHAVLGLEGDVHAAREVVGDQGGHADAEVDVVAVAQLGRGDRGHLVS